MKKLFARAAAYGRNAVSSAVRSPRNQAIAVVGGFAVANSGSAFAVYALPAPVTTAFADMSEAWTLIEAQIWPILAIVVIGFFVIKMFKKGANKVG